MPRHRVGVELPDGTVIAGRVDRGRGSGAARGFGLGLSIAHGGELSLHDRAPHGLIVRMQLPLWQQPRLAVA